MYDFSIGSGTYVCGTPKIYGDDGIVSAGKYCSIAEGLKIFLNCEHHTDWVSTYPFNKNYGTDERNHPFGRGDVIIGNDVWIGEAVTLFSGITIGDGAVIGAGSAVRSSVGPYEVWYGNPCQFRKYRFSRAHIARLIEIKWWDFPHEQVLEIAPALQSNRIEEFIACFQ